MKWGKLPEKLHNTFLCLSSFLSFSNLFFPIVVSTEWRWDGVAKYMTKKWISHSFPLFRYYCVAHCYFSFGGAYCAIIVIVTIIARPCFPHCTNPVPHRVGLNIWAFHLPDSKASPSSKSICILSLYSLILWLHQKKEAKKIKLYFLLAICTRLWVFLCIHFVSANYHWFQWLGEQFCPEFGFDWAAISSKHLLINSLILSSHHHHFQPTKQPTPIPMRQTNSVRTNSFPCWLSSIDNSVFFSSGSVYFN